MTYSLDLLFYESPKVPLPGGPFAQIHVKTHTKDDKAYILVTPRCVSLKEVEKQIERLQGELGIILKNAKQKFSKQPEGPLRQ
jgi:hypothetical protein